MTNFTWDTAHGGLLSVQAPASASGQPRPTMTYTYSTLFAQEKNSAGTLVPVPVGRVMLTQTRQCLTAETCPGTANERVTTYEYNHPNLALTKVTVAAGDGSVSQSIEYGYDLRLNVQYVDGPLAGSTDRVTRFYDLFDRVLGVVYPDPDGAGTLTRPASRYTYDAAGRVSLTEEGNANGVTLAAVNAMTVLRSAENSFDANGRVTIQRFKAGGTTYSVTQTSYDALGRIECGAQRMNPASFAAPPASACTPATPGGFGADRITKFAYGPDGKVLEIRTGVGTALEQVTASYQYNASGSLAALFDAGGSKTSYELDGFDRLTKTIYPSASTPGVSNAADYEVLAYDAGSRVTSFRNRTGESVALSYDNLGRLVSKQLPVRAGLAATHRRPIYFGYDLANNPTSARFDSPSGEGISMAYNALGRIVSSQQTLDGASRTLSYQYDAAGNRTRITHPDGQYWQYAYDKLGRPTSFKEGAVEIGTASYGADGRLGERRWLAPAHNTTLQFSHDPVGRLTAIDGDLAGTAMDFSLDFTLNPANQIVEKSQSNQAYVWDGQLNLERNYDANGLNQYVTAGPAIFCYDANGNLTADGSSVYLYDIENRLVEKRVQTNTTCSSLSYAGTLQAALRYDPLGRLHETVGASGTKRYLYDGLDLVAEYGMTGTLLRRYVHGTAAALDDPLLWYEGASVSAAARRLLLADHQGSIVGVADHQGGTLARNSYDEFGIPGSTNIGRFQYTGQMILDDVGLYHYKARAYSPTLGRFLQPDPIGYGDGTNIYGYVGNDPVNFVDPMGLKREFRFGPNICVLVNVSVGGAPGYGFNCSDDGSGIAFSGMIGILTSIGDEVNAEIKRAREREVAPKPAPEGGNGQDNCGSGRNLVGALAQGTGHISTLAGVVSDAGWIASPKGGLVLAIPADVVASVFDIGSLGLDSAAGNDTRGRDWNAVRRLIPTVTIGQLIYDASGAERTVPVIDLLYQPLPEVERICGAHNWWK